MVQTTRARITDWLAPGFLIALVVAFLIAPFPLSNKLDAVCFGI